MNPRRLKDNVVLVFSVLFAVLLVVFALQSSTPALAAPGDSCTSNLDCAATEFCDGSIVIGSPQCSPVGICLDNTWCTVPGYQCDPNNNVFTCTLECDYGNPLSACPSGTTCQLSLGTAGLCLPGDSEEDEEIECSDDIVEGLIDAAVGFLLGFVTQTVPTTDFPASMKEAYEDCVAWVQSGITLEKMTDEAVNYVSNGFDGNPAFVTNIGREVSRTGEGAFLSFTKSGWISSVSPSLRDTLVFNLINNYNEQNDFASRISSTLDEDLYDIDAFLGGDFNQQGGWDTFYKVSQEPQNNMLGGLLMAREEADRQIESGVAAKKTEIDIGNGFLSREVCEASDAPPNADGSTPPLNCKIVTLGSIIGDQLNRTLGTGIELGTVADELNEPLSAVQKGLVTQVLAGEGGLLGVNDFIQNTSGFEDAVIEEINGSSDATSVACAQTNPSPGNGPINISADGPFSQENNTSIGVNLSGHYTAGTFDFDFYLDEIPPPQGAGTGGEPWRAYFQLRTTGDTRANWFTGLVASDGDNIYSTIGNGPEGQTWHRSNNHAFSPQGWYHVTVEYVAGGDSTFTLFRGQGTGGDVAHREEIRTLNSIFPFHGNPQFFMGNASVPIDGALTENVEIHLTPGPAVCGGAQTGGTGGGTTSGGTGGGPIEP